MLHAALERAVKERLISRNPTEDCIAPKPRKLQMQILPPEAIHAYLEAAKARELLPMFYLELVGGLRKGELLALRWDNADIQNRKLDAVAIYSANGGRPADPGAQQASGLPYLFPSQITGEMYSPVFRGQPP